MRLSNVRQIVSEDFKPEDRDTIARLGGILNFFMRQVVQLSNGNIDFENTPWDIISVDVTVTSGTPNSTTRFNTQVTNPRGMIVINAQNLTTSSNFPTSQPFISFTPKGDGITTVNHVSGLQNDEKYRLTVIVF